jgi:DNA-binding transcriptional LysR family regulator
MVLRSGPPVEVLLESTNRRVDVIREGFDLAIREGLLFYITLSHACRGGRRSAPQFGGAAHNRAYRFKINFANTDAQLRADNLRSFSCVQRYVSALAAAAELQSEPGLAWSG